MSAINNLIGQEQAKRVANRFVYSVTAHPDKVADSLCLIGPPSAGKTILASAIAEDCGLPLLELQPQSIRKADKLMDAIQAMEFPIDEVRAYQAGGPTPRLVIFIDEVHQITNAIEQALLKALEVNDRLLESEDGRKLDTSRFVFIFATTDRGDLFDALDTRTVKIPLRLYSQAEVSAIVQLNFPEWSSEVCDLVAHYNSTIPREALAFARDMQVESEMTGNRDFKQIASVIAQDHHIDEDGMTQQRLAILTSLGQSPISRSRIRHVAQVKDAELQKFVLPPLLAVLPDRAMPLVTVSNKGYTITPAGIAELDKRDIPNRRLKAIPEAVRSLFPDDEPEAEDDEMPTFVRLGDVERKACT